jgi:FkbM family methyltransferase
LGLARQHVLVETRLRRPTPFLATLDLHSWLQRIAFLTGAYEDDAVAFLYRLYRSHHREGYVLDIGANIGLVSIPLAIVIKESQRKSPCVVSIEAVPDNARALEANIALNTLQADILVLSAALGDACKDIEIQVEGNLLPGEGTGTANILPDGSTYRCVRQKLALQTIDSLWAAGRMPSGCAVMKIDVDGYDLKVLQGAETFLNRERPVVFGEFSAHCLRWHGQSLNDINEFARERDYCVWQRLPNSWAFSSSSSVTAYIQDLLLVPSEKVRSFEWCLSRQG